MTGEKIKRLLLKLVIGIFILAVLGIGYCRYAQSSRKRLLSEEIRNGVLQQTWDQLAVNEKNEIVNGWESGSVRLDTLVYADIGCNADSDKEGIPGGVCMSVLEMKKVDLGELYSLLEMYGRTYGGVPGELLDSVAAAYKKQGGKGSMRNPPWGGEKESNHSGKGRKSEKIKGKGI